MGRSDMDAHLLNATGVGNETNRIGGGGTGGNTGPVTSTSIPGGHSEREPPDPIPNSEVKTLCADGSVPFRHARVGHCQDLETKAPVGKPAGAFCWCARRQCSIVRSGHTRRSRCFLVPEPAIRGGREQQRNRSEPQDKADARGASGQEELGDNEALQHQHSWYREDEKNCQNDARNVTGPSCKVDQQSL